MIRTFLFSIVSCFFVFAQSPDQQIQKLESNITTLKKDLDTLRQSLKTQKPSKIAAPQSSPVSLSSYALEIGVYFQDKKQSLEAGFYELIRGQVGYDVSHKFWPQSLFFFLFGLFLVFGVIHIQARELWKKWRVTMLDRDPSLMVSLVVSGLLVPVFFYSMIEVISIGSMGIGGYFHINIPFFLYVLWAGHQGWTWITEHPQLRPLNTLRSWWMMGVVFYVIAHSIFLLNKEAVTISAGLQTIFDISTTIFLLWGLIFLYKLQKKVQDLENAPETRISRWIFLTRLTLITFYLIELTYPQAFHLIITPIISALMCFPLVYPLQRFLRRVRIHDYLAHKKRKSRTSFIRVILQSKQGIRNLSWIIISTIYMIWALSFWQFNPEIWLQNIVQTKLFHQICDSTLLLFGAYCVVRSGDRILQYYLEKKNFPHIADNDVMISRLKTLLTIARTLLRTGVWLPAIFLILSIFGYDITPLVTSLGVLSLGMSLGVQSFVKDFVAGFFMILENTLVVGDYVNIDNRIGVVEGLSLRTLRIRMDNGTLSTIPFGTIQVVGNLSRAFSCAVLNVSVPYDQDVDLIHDLLSQAEQEVRKDPAISKKYRPPIEIRGINDVTDYSMIFQVRLHAAPGKQETIRRKYTQALKKLFDKHKIRVPSPTSASQNSKPSIAMTVTPPTS